MSSPHDAGIFAEGLGKRYGDLWALRDLDLDVPAGTVLGLLGHNGAGKTTAIRILTTLLRPTEGRATRRRPRRRRRARRRVRTQHRPRRPAGHRRRPAHGARQPRDGRPPLPPAARRGPRAGPTSCSSGSTSPTPPTGWCETFSGGMRRRLDLAASLVAAPPVLFLDEPTTGPRSPQPQRAVGPARASSCATAPRCCSPPSTSRRPTAWPTTSSCSTTAASSPRARPAELKARIGGERLEVTVGGAERARGRGRGARRTFASDGPSSTPTAPASSRPVTAGVALVEVVRALDAAGVDAIDLHRREATLDDVFLALTDSTPTTEEVAA